MTAAALDGDPVALASIKKLVRGKTWDPIVVVKDKDTGVPLDLSGWDGVRCDLRVGPNDPTPAASPTCTVLDLPYSGSPTGRVQLKLTAAITEGIDGSITQLKGDPEFYKVVSLEEIVRTPFNFTVEVLPEYTWT